MLAVYSSNHVPHILVMRMVAVYSTNHVPHTVATPLSLEKGMVVVYILGNNACGEYHQYYREYLIPYPSHEDDGVLSLGKYIRSTINRISCSASMSHPTHCS